MRRIVAITSGVRYFSQAVAPLSIQAPPPAAAGVGAVKASIASTAARAKAGKREKECVVIVFLDGIILGFLLFSQTSHSVHGVHGDYRQLGVLRCAVVRRTCHGNRRVIRDA